MLNRCQQLLVFLLPVFMVISLGGLSQAQTNLRTALLLDAGVAYDSNFYFDANDEIGVTTFLIQPGMEVWFETPKTEWAAHYNLDANYYDRSEEDNFYGHTAFLLGDIELTDRLSLELSDNFRYTRDSVQLDPLGNSANREKYYQNRAKALFSYYFEPKFTVEAGYQNWITDYRNGSLEDADGHQGIFDLIYHLNRSTSLDLEYHYWDMNYDGATPDYTSNQLSLVARKEWLHTALELGVGYQKRSFTAPGDSAQDPDDIEVVPYRFRIEASSTSGKSRLTMSADHNFNYLNLSSQGYYEADRYGLTIDHDLTERITAGLRGFYQKSDYEDSSRDDDTYNITGEINYLMKEWLVFLVSAGYETRNSNMSAEDYDNTTVMGQLQFKHSLGR